MALALIRLTGDWRGCEGKEGGMKASGIVLYSSKRRQQPAEKSLRAIMIIALMARIGGIRARCKEREAYGELGDLRLMT
ncbi:hypothetical protein DMENIID0001_144980 [Sergentomyia squamirostris]